MSVAERVLPHDLDAEKAVLGALLISARAWPTVASSLQPEDFFRDAHQRIYRACRALAAEGTALDLLTVRSALQKSGELDTCGGAAYIASLTDGTLSGNAEHYAGIVAEHKRLRELIREASWVVSSAYDGELRAADVANEAVRRLSGAIGAAGRGGLTLAAAAVREYVDAMVAGTAGTLVSSFYTDLDNLVGGFRQQDLVIVAARPSTGKTSLCLGAADRMAASGLVVPFFSLEMGQALVASRLLSWWSDVPSAAFERGTANDAQYVSISEATARADQQGRPLYLNTSARTVTEIWGWCRRLRAERGLGCVFIDYLQLLIPEGRAGSSQDDTAGVSRNLKAMAKDLGVPVVALSQLNRAPEARSDKRPHMSELRGSGALEQDADLGILLFRPEMYGRTDENAGITEVIVAKNRMGPVGPVKVFFEREFARFSDLAHGGAAPPDGAR